MNGDIVSMNGFAKKRTLRPARQSAPSTAPRLRVAVPSHHIPPIEPQFFYHREGGMPGRRKNCARSRSNQDGTHRKSGIVRT